MAMAAIIRTIIRFAVFFFFMFHLIDTKTGHPSLGKLRGGILSSVG